MLLLLLLLLLFIMLLFRSGHTGNLMSWIQKSGGVIVRFAIGVVDVVVYIVSP